VKESLQYIRREREMRIKTTEDHLQHLREREREREREAKEERESDKVTDDSKCKIRKNVKLREIKIKR